MLLQSLTGAASATDSQAQNARCGKQADIIVSELHGKYAEQNARGNVFKGKSASTGIALIVPGTGGGHPTLWNPAGQGVNVSIIRLVLSYVSGTCAPTAIEWARTLNAGAAAATGSPIATATLVTPDPGVLGGAGVAKALWSPTTNTFAAAPAFYEPTGLSLATMAAATATMPPPLIVNYDGDLILAPNTALSLCTQAATSTALFQVLVTWEEIPIYS